MKLYLKCPNCKYENSFKSNASTRVEFVMVKNKKTIEINCVGCNKKISASVNKIYAKESKSAFLIAGIIFMIGSILILIIWSKILSNSKNAMGLYAVALLLLVPVWIYIIIQKQERIRVSTFNHTYVNDYH
ncbi:MAG TPA: hypothetical protein PKH16_00870 [Aequorivita sp.]|nr:hypothetical protein [Aequorivita sp.]